MTTKILVEEIVSSLDDARAAAAGGADRFELCSSLALGGLTPSLGLLEVIRAELRIPIMAMIRPREGGMRYSQAEFGTMLRDAELALEAGADGLVFGFLNEDGHVDLQRSKTFVELIHRTPRVPRPQSVFHRAFDVTADPELALEQLIDLGITRILTSGRAPTALEGIDEIRRTVERADRRIEVLPGGGISCRDVEKIVRETGVDQIHVYVTRGGRDPSTTGNPKIYFGAHQPQNEVEYRVVDQQGLAELKDLVNPGVPGRNP